MQNKYRVTITVRAASEDAAKRQARRLAFTYETVGTVSKETS